MQSGEFVITGNSADDFGTLFTSPSLDNNKEVILQRTSDRDLAWQTTPIPCSTVNGP
jgi:hypothetical protein